MKTSTPCQGVSKWARKTTWIATVAVSLCFPASGWAQADNNPNVARQCGADIVLVLDASDSIRTWLPANPTELDRNGAVDLVTEAAYSFLGAFSNTNSRVAVVSYNIDAIKQVGFRFVNDHSLRSGGPFEEAIGDPGTSAGGLPANPVGYVADVADPSQDTGFYTNWEAALVKARSIVRPQDGDLATRPDVPLLIFHVTDGSPNRRLNNAGEITDQESNGQHVSDAAAVADLLKQQDNAHLYTVGVGGIGAGELIDSIDNLIAISGPDVFYESDPQDTFNPISDDVLIASDFEQLQGILGGVVLSLCSPSLIVRKWEQTAVGSDDYGVAAGWEFESTPLADQNYWTWTTPEDGASVVTDARGIARFEWELVENSVWNASQVQVRELSTNEDFEFDGVSCEITGGENIGQSVASPIISDSGVFAVELDGNEIVTCDVYNNIVDEEEPLLPSIVLDKKVDREEFHAAGELIHYEYVVENAGPGILVDVITVEDDKIGDVTCPGELPNGELKPGESVTCFASYAATEADVLAAKITNIAIAEAGLLKSNKDDETVIYREIDILLPSIVLDKQVDREKFFSDGEKIYYTYDVTNVGPGTLTDLIRIEDDKIDSVECPGELPGGELKPGESVRCTATYVATPDDVLAERIRNEATAFAGSLRSNTDIEIVLYEILDDITPVIVLDKHTDSETYEREGQSIDYTYTVTNVGEGVLLDQIIVYDDKIPGVFCPDLPGGRLERNQFIVCTATYVVTADDIVATRIKNVAYAEAGILVSNEDEEVVEYQTTKIKDDKTPTKIDDKSGVESASDSTSDLSSKTESTDRRSLATRTAQWYAARSSDFLACLDAAGGEIDLGTVRIADEQFDDEIDARFGGRTYGDSDTQAETAFSLGLGLLNADSRNYSDGSRRTRLDQACFATGRQILAASCNIHWLEAGTDLNLSRTVSKVSRLCRDSSKGRSRRIKRLKEIRTELKRFNRSGQFEELSVSTLRSGPATLPVQIRLDDPTDPHD